MPFDKPGLGELTAAAEADIEARLPGANARLRQSNLGVLARVLAGAEVGLYDFIDWASRQFLVDTAEIEQLDRHGSIWGVVRTPASFATGLAAFTGADGAVIPAGTRVRRADGSEYVTNAETAIAASVAVTAVTAVTAGVDGNAAPATAVSLVSPIAGVMSAAVLDGAGAAGGADEETDTAYRTRILERIRQPPHGGAAFDYIAWTLAQPGVTRVWVYPLELGPGTVTVRFMMDDTYTNGVPRPADVTAVKAALDAVRPVSADVTAAAPVATALNFEITGLDPARGAVKDAVEAELKDLIRREAEPGGTLLVSHIREAISIAAGEHDHALVSPTADVTHETGQIAVHGAMVWS